MKKHLFLLTIIVMLFAMVGCAPQAPTTVAPTQKPVASGPVKIVMWHSMSGTMGDTLTALATKYNSTHTKYQIELQFQGAYADALTKFKSTAKADLPDLFMCEAETSGYMMNSGVAQPIQKFIDRDKFDISVLEPDLRNYYTVNGQLMNLGFGRTIVGFIYNVDILTKAGYTDPAAQLKTWDDVMAAAKKIVDGGLAKYGAAINPAGWGFEFYASTVGKQLVDQGNGRSGKPTKSIIDTNGLGEQWFTFLRKWKSSPGILTEFTAGKDYFSAMGAGDLAMFQTTSSNIGTVFAAAGGKFKVGFFPLPASSLEDKGGLTVGGNSTWMINSGNDARMEGGWDWIKFALEKDSVLTWAVGTGYAPITTEVSNSKEYKDKMNEICPTIFTGIEALRKAGPQNVGAYMPIFNKHRTVMWEQMQKVWNDPNYTPKQATDDFVKTINTEFQLYNSTN